MVNTTISFNDPEVATAIQALARFTARGSVKGDLVATGCAGVIWVRADAATGTLTLSTRDASHVEVEYRFVDPNLIGGDLEVAVAAKDLDAAAAYLFDRDRSDSAVQVTGGWLRLGAYNAVQLLDEQVVRTIPVPVFSGFVDIAELPYDPLSLAMKRAGIICSSGDNPDLQRIFIDVDATRLRVAGADSHSVVVEEVATFARQPCRIELPRTLATVASGLRALRTIQTVTLVADDPTDPRRVGLCGPQLAISTPALVSSADSRVFEAVDAVMAASPQSESVSMPVKVWVRFLSRARRVGAGAVRVGFKGELGTVEAVSSDQQLPAGSIIAKGGLVALGATNSAWALLQRDLKGAVNAMRDRPVHPSDEVDDDNDDDDDVVTLSVARLPGGGDGFLLTRPDDGARRVFAVGMAPDRVPASRLAEVASI